MERRSQATPATVAAVAAIVLIVSMLLDWYALDLPEQVGGRPVDAPSFNAFEGLERSDFFLVVMAALALIFAAMLVAGVLSSSPWPGLALLGAGLLALAVVIYRGSSRPVRPFFGGEIDTTLQLGWFVALVAAAVVAGGGMLAYLAGPRLQLEEDELEEAEEPGSGPHREDA